MKNFFNKQRVQLIADEVSDAMDTFNAERFITQACMGLNSMELKARSKHIANALMVQFPVDTAANYARSTTQLLKAMKTPSETLIGDSTNGTMEGFHYLPYLDFVELYGQPYPAQSLKTLERMTMFFSAEFAIRPFLINEPDKTLDKMKQWAKHKDWQVRRLASEGTRPRLPWGIQLPRFIESPSEILPILNELYDDNNLIVRRSVANNLNDIAKDNPEVAANLAATWLSTNESEQARWCAKHGLRTLIKNGNPTALKALGYTGGENITAIEFTLSPSSQSIGEKVTMDFNLHSAELQTSKIVIDYVLERVLANGKLAKKVFKIANTDIDAGQSLSFTKTHDFTQRSTRTYYTGTHTIHLQVNGHIIAHRTFELTE